jgi:hypothetical protein
VRRCGDVLDPGTSGQSLISCFHRFHRFPEAQV